MGCGCNRNKSNKIAKASSGAGKKVSFSNTLKSSSPSYADKAEKRKDIEVKIKFCKFCPHSRSTSEERRKKIRNCHKSNVSLSFIFNTKDFKCPIGNF